MQLNLRGKYHFVATVTAKPTGTTSSKLQMVYGRLEIFKHVNDKYVCTNM